MDYEIDLPEHLAHRQLPKLIIQPLVENCITHGYANCVGHKRIVIACKGHGQGYCIQIRDSGSGFSQDILEQMHALIQQLKLGDVSLPATSHGLGLKNTLARTFLFCKGNADARLYNDHGAVVELIINGESEESWHVSSNCCG